MEEVLKRQERSDKGAGRGEQSTQGRSAQTGAQRSERWKRARIGISSHREEKAQGIRIQGNGQMRRGHPPGGGTPVTAIVLLLKSNLSWAVLPLLRKLERGTGAGQVPDKFEKALPLQSFSLPGSYLDISSSWRRVAEGKKSLGQGNGRKGGRLSGEKPSASLTAGEFIESVWDFVCFTFP